MNNYYEYNDLYRNMNMPSLFSPMTGYDNGNLFSNLYSQYKNYEPIKLVASNEKESMLYELSRFSFAAHELNLYLDLHPDDQGMLNLFNDYKNKYNILALEYEKRFGPLTTGSTNMNKIPFTWESSSWPWRGDFYV